MIYNNTIYTPGDGIQFGSPAVNGGIVAGNLVFARNGISAADSRVFDNLTASAENAPATFASLPSIPRLPTSIRFPASARERR